MQLDPHLVDRAMEQIQKSRANYDYFFERLSSPKWIGPLAERSLFSNPPPPEIDERGISAPMWPPSQFLARVAHEAPEEVWSIISQIETMNERVRGDFADAALKMPAALMRRWAEKEIFWLRQNGYLYFDLPRKIVTVIGRLAANGETDVSLALVTELFRASGEGSAGPVRPVSPRFSTWMYDDLLNDVLLGLLAVSPLDTIRVLVNLLRKVIELASPEMEAGEDFSKIWRPRLATNDKNDRDLLQSLTSALRDSASTVRINATVSDMRLIDLLFDGGSKIFRRVAAFALLNGPAPNQRALRRVLVDRAAFSEREPSTEYRELLADRFPCLSKSSQATILRWVNQGPSVADGAAPMAMEDDHRTSYEVQEIQRKLATWRIRRLRLIIDYLPATWRRRYDDLVSRFGEDEFITSFEVSFSWGPKSPLKLEDLDGHSDEELVQLLHTYDGSGSVLGPSPEGLARTLSELAQTDPDRMSRLAPRLKTVRPVYVYWTLLGIENAVRQDKQVRWTELLELLHHGVDVSLGEDLLGRDEDHYGRWAWVRKEVAGTLDAGLRSVTVGIPFDLRSYVWPILRTLTEDPEPTPEYEEQYGGSNMDPATLALNTTRGRAMLAVMAFALWWSRHLGDAMPVLSRTSGLDAMPHVREILDQHLDPEADPSEAVRAAYGQTLPWLVNLDKSWVEGSLSRIFPETPGERNLRDAAWCSYIIFCRPYDDVFGVLRQQYSDAVERLDGPWPAWRWIGGESTPQRRLIQHVLAFYSRGILSLHEGDQIIQRLFERASPELRAHGIEFIGRGLHQAEAPNEAVLDRLQELWRWRIETAEAAPAKDSKVELSAYSWWADADVLPPAWRMEQLERVLGLGGSMKHESVAISAIGRLSKDFPLRAGRQLRVYLEKEKEGWTIQMERAQIHAILHRCLTADDLAARDVAFNIVHWLGSLGHSSFRQLLADMP